MNIQRAPIPVTGVNPIDRSSNFALYKYEYPARTSSVGFGNIDTLTERVFVWTTLPFSASGIDRVWFGNIGTTTGTPTGTATLYYCDSLGTPITGHTLWSGSWSGTTTGDYWNAGVGLSVSITFPAGVTGFAKGDRIGLMIQNRHGTNPGANNWTNIQAVVELDGMGGWLGGACYSADSGTTWTRRCFGTPGLAIRFGGGAMLMPPCPYGADEGGFTASIASGAAGTSNLPLFNDATFRAHGFSSEINQYRKIYRTACLPLSGTTSAASANSIRCVITQSGSVLGYSSTVSTPVYTDLTRNGRWVAFDFPEGVVVAPGKFYILWYSTGTSETSGAGPYLAGTLRPANTFLNINPDPLYESYQPVAQFSGSTLNPSPSPVVFSSNGRQAIWVKYFYDIVPGVYI